MTFEFTIEDGQWLHIDWNGKIMTPQESKKWAKERQWIDDQVDTGAKSDAAAVEVVGSGWLERRVGPQPGGIRVSIQTQCCVG